MLLERVAPDTVMCRAWDEFYRFYDRLIRRFVHSFGLRHDQVEDCVCRYVERNGLRARLVPHPDAWRWSSLWRREHGSADDCTLLSEWPVRCPRDWLSWVKEPQTEAELDSLRRSITRGCPYGSESWVERAVKKLGLEITQRPRGRPKKSAKGS